MHYSDNKKLLLVLLWHTDTEDTEGAGITDAGTTVAGGEHVVLPFLLAVGGAASLSTRAYEGYLTYQRYKRYENYYGVKSKYPLYNKYGGFVGLPSQSYNYALSLYPR